jgi:hypothetical protein
VGRIRIGLGGQGSRSWVLIRGPEDPRPLAFERPSGTAKLLGACSLARTPIEEVCFQV